MDVSTAASALRTILTRIVPVPDADKEHARVIQALFADGASSIRVFALRPTPRPSLAANPALPSHASLAQE